MFILSDVDQITEPLDCYYLGLPLCSVSLKQDKTGTLIRACTSLGRVTEGGASFNDFRYTLAL